MHTRSCVSIDLLYSSPGLQRPASTLSNQSFLSLPSLSAQLATLLNDDRSLLLYSQLACIVHLPSSFFSNASIHLFHSEVMFLLLSDSAADSRQPMTQKRRKKRFDRVRVCRRHHYVIIFQKRLPSHSSPKRFSQPAWRLLRILELRLSQELLPCVSI